MTTAEIVEHIKLVISAVRYDGSYPAESALAQEFSEIAALSAERDSAVKDSENSYSKEEWDDREKTHNAELERAKSDAVHVQQQHAKVYAALKGELERVRGERDIFATLQKEAKAQEHLAIECNHSLGKTVDDLRAKLAAAEALLNAAVSGKATAEHRVSEVCKERDALREQLDAIARAVYPDKEPHFTYSSDFIVEEIGRLREQVARLEADGKRREC